MPLNDWEMSYAGTTFGADLYIGLLEVRGLDVPALRVDALTRSLEHGSVVYSKYYPSRVITLKGDIRAIPAGANFATQVQTVRSMLQPQSTPQPLNFKIPNEVEKLVYCIPTKGPTFPHGRDYSIEYTEWLAELTAADPRIYDATETTVVASGSTAVCVNSGNFGTLPTITVNGPVTNPTLTLGSEQLALTYTLPSGQSLVYDFEERTIYNGATSIYYALDLENSVWFDLEPGSNSVLGPASFSVVYRSAWI